MKGKDNFKMYAMYVNEPYIVEEKDIPEFFKKSKEQNGMAKELSVMFKDEWFEFSVDEDGNMSGVIEVEEAEGEEDDD